VRIKIKPLSVNDAWKGRRYKTEEYKAFEQHVSLLLKPVEIPEGPLQIHIIWGFSSAGSDYDNPIKPFQDCLQKKYGFNDNRIQRGIIDKVKVKKGAEFIEWKLLKFNGFTEINK
jgi:Holliday junction resolvase RusA-like endonuclease